MNAQEQSSLAVVDTELFKIYAHYQLCRVKKGIVGSSEAAEKKAIVQILEACQHINADTFHALVSDLLKHSVPVQPSYEGGLTTLFHSTTASPLNHIHAGRKRASKDRSSAATSQEHDMDRTYSSEQSESEESDDEGPAIITPKRKRARSASNTGSRQDSSTSGQKYSLSSLSINALNYLSTVPQKTKQDLFKRMKTTTDSFRIDYSISQEGKNPVKSFQIQFTERFPPQSIYHQCQTNLVGYRLGQIINREALVFPIMAQEENKRLYFAQGLNNTKPTSKLGEFTKYCKALTRMVEETGVYCLFMPEVVPPTFYRRAGEDLLKTTIDCMQKKFSQFANIASIDENGDLFIADSEDMGDEAGGGADEAVNKNKDTNESEVDEAVDKNKDTNESEVDDARQDVKTEAVECSADKRQEVNEDTPSWHTMEW